MSFGPELKLNERGDAGVRDIRGRRNLYEFLLEQDQDYLSPCPRTVRTPNTVAVSFPPVA